MPDRFPRRCLAGCTRSHGKRRGGVIAWMLDDVEFRELRIFLAVLVAAMRETGAQRPGAGVRAGCPLPWPASPPARGAWPPGRTRPSAAQTVNVETPVAAAICRSVCPAASSPAIRAASAGVSFDALFGPRRTGQAPPGWHPLRRVRHPDPVPRLRLLFLVLAAADPLGPDPHPGQPPHLPVPGHPRRPHHPDPPHAPTISLAAAAALTTLAARLLRQRVQS
jgi:hypothetical protein